MKRVCDELTITVVRPEASSNLLPALRRVPKDVKIVRRRQRTWNRTPNKAEQQGVLPPWHGHFFSCQRVLGVYSACFAWPFIAWPSTDALQSDHAPEMPRNAREGGAGAFGDLDVINRTDALLWGHQGHLFPHHGLSRILTKVTTLYLRAEALLPVSPTGLCAGVRDHDSGLMKR
eukprot:CAMPEP_0117470516 /NCGR_PEP_ID=MMETSP0784-20121206/7257_1 /TAXON_ID=39447 /ORGANISM="" /LENGTH=174 /DNA_ID=CAMNT_0005264609 /DNA_START=399 /DNA_END=925 /DNA_ORIENTATION=+